jgi:hypothetical protein
LGRHRVRRAALCGLVLGLAAAPARAADTASGSVIVAGTGPIAVSHAAAYVVRDRRNARTTQTEILLADVPLDPASLRTAFDPHMTAINLEALRDRNYVLLWVGRDGRVGMNATFSKTMTQFIDDTGGGLEVAWKTRSASRLDGRLFSPRPLKTLDGTTYTVDLSFAVDVETPAEGPVLAAGGGDPGQALTAFLAAVARKDWAAIKAGSSPAALEMFDRNYNTTAENVEGTADLLKAWIGATPVAITGGQLDGSVAILDVEAEMFPGQRGLSRVRMIRSGGAWQFDRAVRAGFVP